MILKIRKMKDIHIINLGLIDYQVAYKKQTKLFKANIEAKKAGKPTQNTLIFCEHPHVYTIGKNGNENNLLVDDDFLNAIQATYFRTDRGGDITYHGYGQIVGYPVFDLDSLNLSIKNYVYLLENSLITLLKQYGIHSETKQNAVGVWIDKDNKNARKIAAIGVKVSRGISMHGFALNVNTDLSYFDYINPCGFTDKPATSMQKELGKMQDVDEIRKKTEEIFKNLKVN